MSINHLEALDMARNDRWDEAHRLVQQYSDPLSCLIHAWLHRQEGDNWNAGYWYSRAGSEMPDNTLEEELQRLYTLAQAAQRRDDE